VIRGTIDRNLDDGLRSELNKTTVTTYHDHSIAKQDDGSRCGHSDQELADSRTQGMPVMQQKLLILRADIESNSVQSEVKLILLQCIISSHITPLECSQALYRISIQISNNAGQRSVVKQFQSIAKLLKRLCKQKLVLDGLSMRAMAAACLVLILLPIQLFGVASAEDNLASITPHQSEKIVGYISYALCRLSIVLGSVTLSKPDLVWLLAFNELQSTDEKFDHVMKKPISDSRSQGLDRGGIDRLVSFLKKRYHNRDGCKTSLWLQLWSAVLEFDYESQQLIESPIKEIPTVDIQNSLVTELSVQRCAGCLREISHKNKM
jgi:hypothetical protein